MKAFIYDKYGPPQTLRMAEAGKPAPDAGEVLVKMLAIPVTAADRHSMRGKLCSRAPPWDCCGRNIRSSASTLPGRWRRPAAALPGSSPARGLANELPAGPGGDGPADQDVRGDTETAPSRPVVSEPAMMRPMGPRRGPSVLSAGLPGVSGFVVNLSWSSWRSRFRVVVSTVGPKPGIHPGQIDQGWVSP
jgi:hypothetical protein